jgi:hypothetical protein
MGMHGFGEKRFGSGLADDLRSRSNSNTRVVGDFTKSITLSPIVQTMRKKLSEDADWRAHVDQALGAMNEASSALIDELLSLERTPFRRHFLQTRFFELGNNCKFHSRKNIGTTLHPWAFSHCLLVDYLGMEFCREFEAWKSLTVSKLQKAVQTATQNATSQGRTKALYHLLNRLWYEAALAVMGSGMVYNSGSGHRIPQLRTMESAQEKRLKDLQAYESFRLARFKAKVVSHGPDSMSLVQRAADEQPVKAYLSSHVYVVECISGDKRSLRELAVGDSFEVIDTLEVVAKRSRTSVVRSCRGFVFSLPNDCLVLQGSDLARSPDGYSESKVALATFPVAHEVCHRTFVLNLPRSRERCDGYITTFIGDYQASVRFIGDL